MRACSKRVLCVALALLAVLGSVSAACNPACSGNDVCLTNAVNNTYTSCQGSGSLATDGLYQSIAGGSVVYPGLGVAVTLKMYIGSIAVGAAQNPAGWYVVLATSIGAMPYENVTCTNFQWDGPYANTIV